MRHDLKKPCRNCPFRKDGNRITFANRERAEEIEESAYRHGFPCHKSAELIEGDDGDGGYVAGRNTQLCVGYAIMQLNESGNSPWPGIGNSQRIIDGIDRRVDSKTRREVFRNTDEFLAANDERRAQKKARPLSRPGRV